MYNQGNGGGGNGGMQNQGGGYPGGGMNMGGMPNMGGRGPQGPGNMNVAGFPGSGRRRQMQGGGNRNNAGMAPLDPLMGELFGGGGGGGGGGQRNSFPNGNGVDGMPGGQGGGGGGPPPGYGVEGFYRGNMTNAVLGRCIEDLRNKQTVMNTMSNIGGGAGGQGNGMQQRNMMGDGRPQQGNGDGNPDGYGASMTRQQQLEEIRAKQMELEREKVQLEMRQRMLQTHMQQQQQQQTDMGYPPMQGGGYGGPPGMMGGMGMGGGMGAGGHPNDDGGMAGQKWWICNVCNSQAFASRTEAMAHEGICQGNRGAQVAAPTDPPFYSPTSAKPTTTGSGYGMPPNPQSQMAPEHHQELLDESQFTITDPLSLSMESDKDWLTPLHCFVRQHCVQVFCATAQDVATPSKGKRKPIQVGQVGIRCPHCHNAEGNRERGSVYYPTTISSIYNATMNLLQRHLHSCSSVPEDIMRKYQTLKSDDARSGTSKKYWVESALSLGLVDTPSGIRFSARSPPALPRLSRPQQQSANSFAEGRNSSDFMQSNAVAELAKRMEGDTGGNQSSGDGDGGPSKTPGSGPESKGSGPLVTPEDKPYATAFSYHLLSQMQSCVFTEADRLGKRKGLPAGFAGLACRHCFGGYGSGRFFPSSIKTLSDTSKTLNVLHNHMMRCRKCPQEVRDQLEKLRAHHDDERSKMKFGSQKAFFAKIWARLHENKDPLAATRGNGDAGMKRKFSQFDAQQKQQQMHQQMVQANMQHQHNKMMHGMMGGGNSGGGMGPPPPPPMGPLSGGHGMYGMAGGGGGGMQQHNMSPQGMMGGLDLLSRQADQTSDMNKRQRM
eukprot:CAMPEP_0194033836 /NCGR_PEP_ID=MMETSP0009_2-20130614/6352_1 /TAXON_ID=210454 /ORGANISM="Grammatophora oceanica, Strain CCMP 410" /LENGTH=829 /DNA_ID=CAMNT_0038674565 /DNA_START=372 /DNA_END=2861 /DNA_ORIENTATION=-